MDITPVKTPLLIQKTLAYHVWSVPSEEKVLYLTFDDGPTPKVTDWTLDILDKYNAKATFFCIGKNIEAHPNLFNKIIKKGHSIGNHTQHHLKGWKTHTLEYLKDVELAQKIIEDYTNVTLNSQHKLFRPPYGKLKPKQSIALHKQNYKTVMWSILSKDWDATLTKEQCLNNVISKTTKGDIIVFHDSVKASKNMQYALPKVLEYFTERGYVFKRILAQDL